VHELQKSLYIGINMNIGFYIKSLTEEKQLEFANQVINNAIDNELASDASLFYDGIGFVPYFFQCGLFNATDLWNFRGSLIVMNIECLKKAMKIVNNIKIFYCYGWESIDVFNLLFIKNNKIPILCRTEEDNKKLYRLTGGYADLCIKNDAEIIDFLKV
jgi:hypothetical protein